MAPRRLPSIHTPELIRPQPPAEVLAAGPLEAPAVPFLPAPELDTWARGAFLGNSAPFFDDRLAHLQPASIAWLWASEPSQMQGKMVIGTYRRKLCTRCSRAMYQGGV